MAFVPSMSDEEAATNLVGEETLDPSPPSPTLVQPTDDEATVPATGSILQSSEPERTLDCSLSREQVTAGLQPHLAAAENRVSKALQQVMESIESRLLGALRQAAIDIIENLGKEAAACLLLSERKSAVLDHQLNYTKQQALSMLMRLKQVTDAQISDAERQILIERRRAQEAEAKLFTTQESNKRLRAELKRKGQLLEEFQRVYPAAAQQGLQVGSTKSLECRKGGSRLKGSGGQKHLQQSSSTPSEPISPPMSAGVTTFGHLVKNMVEPQTEHITAQLPIHSSTCHDAYTATRIQTIEILPSGKSNLKVKELLLSTGNGHMGVKELHGQQGSPTNESASLREAENIPATLHSLSENSHPDINQVSCSPSSREKCQLPSSLKVDSELRSTKDSDEEKSCLTIEALYCNDESLPAQVHPVEEYQSYINHVGMDLQTSDAPTDQISCGKKHGHETDVSVDRTEQLEVEKKPERDGEALSNTSRIPKINKGKDKGSSSSQLSSTVAEQMGEVFGIQEKNCGLECGEGIDNVVMTEKVVAKTLVASPVVTNPNSDAPLASSPVVKSTLNHIASNLPIEDPYRPETRIESSSTQLLKRKRKQGVPVSKYDCLAIDRNSKRLEDEGAVTGAFDLLTASGVDAHISSRDSRRLMQGARQLFSLAERKRR